jgi:nicotinate-nucleotide adenylyltransferase
LAALKIGVFGGTFNPIHLGHLHIAHRAQCLFGLSQIYFVVATAPPHKAGEDLPPLFQRYVMVSLATAGRRSFIPSLIELEKPVSPFTIHTMRKLARLTGCKEKMLYFIAGSDSLVDISTWKDSEELLTSYNFIFAARPGITLENPSVYLPKAAQSSLYNLIGLGPRQIRQNALSKPSAKKGRIFVADLDALDISASRIRELAANGRRLHNHVSVPVQEYIQKLKLYGER